MSYSGMGTTSLIDIIAPVAQAHRAMGPAAASVMSTSTLRAAAQAAAPSLPGRVSDLCRKAGDLRSWATQGYTVGGSQMRGPSTLRARDGTTLTPSQALALLNHQDLLGMCRLDPSMELTGDGLKTHAYVHDLWVQVQTPSIAPTVLPDQPLPTTQVPSSTFTPRWGNYLPYAVAVAGLIGIGYLIARKTR